METNCVINMKIATGKQSRGCYSSTYARTLLVWFTSIHPPFVRLSRNVVRFVGSYLYSYRLLAAIDHSQVLYFDIDQKEWRLLFSLTHNLDQYWMSYALTFLFDCFLFVCGGCSNSNTHIIDSGVVRHLADMLVPRKAHSIVFVPEAEAVFAFGGLDVNSWIEALSVCEKFDLTTEKWTQSGLMNRTRSKFNASLWLNLVYLCSGNSDKSVETFDWRKSRFELLSFRSISGRFATISVISGGTLLCLSQNAVWKWRVGTVEDTKKRRNKTGEHLYSIGGGVVADGVLYSVNESQCRAFRIDTGECLGSWKAQLRDRDKSTISLDFYILKGMLAAPPHQSGRFLSSKLTRTLLIWTAAHSPLLSPLPLCVLRAISSYLFHYRFLALIYHSTICYFDTEDKEWKQLSSLRRSLAAHSQAYSMTFIQDYYVFVCGGMGSPPSATAHLVEFQTVTILRDMRVGRSGHSLAYVPQADAVFVFGGINSRLQPITGRLDVCEKFELATGRWGKMQRMTEPRANFNSVVHENVVYICGGSGKRTIETYDWTKDEFAVMAIRGVSGLGPTIATVHCGRLICVSRRGVWKWRIGTSEVETLKVRTERQLHSVAAGRVIAGVMYSVSDSQCIGIRLDTGEEVGCWKFLRFAVL